MKHTQGPWTSTFTLKKERGVRSEGGFICFLPKPSHYAGQDERYENELEESKANATLIAAAPDLLLYATNSLLSERTGGFSHEGELISGEEAKLILQLQRAEAIKKATE